MAEKLGPVLVQLPQSLMFDPKVADAFLAAVRDRWNGPVALEPRHASWFGALADVLISAHRIARVGADPARTAAAAMPGGYPGLAYWRLHGAPRVYYSAYGSHQLAALAVAMGKDRDRETWCIFDNTASGAAAANALTLATKLGILQG